MKAKYWFNRAASNKEPKSIQILQQLGWSRSLPDGSEPTEQTAEANSDSQANPDNTQLDSTQNVATNQLDDETTTSSLVKPEPVSAPVAEVAETPIEEKPLSVYTDPEIRSVLISIFENRSGLSIVDEGDEWVTVQSDTGLPVWIHGDFLSISGDDDNQTATITGNTVNARSVPVIASGTVVGRLSKDEEVAVLSERNSWYRVTSPSRFYAYARKADFSNETLNNNQSDDSAASNVAVDDTANIKNENEWLYAQDGNRFTLQLASFDDPSKIDLFLTNSKLKGDENLRRFKSKGKNIEWIYFLYGSYSTRELAEQAKADISQNRAWVRSFKLLQQNRCVSWKKQFPTPSELNTYCKN